ncbi:transcription factor bHLH113-like isoform X4 [Momordica charantia]|uniref:Transcription factor bHLH113-like isoform X4 n=1 Tax=Momordica charantia TaxID=3673 RepID=A0A6J1D3N3_MOMCH|nr:transcription factor bHLH113-like isoform X4 [Momordica charantia]
MAENQASGGDHLGAAAPITGAAAGTTFSQLLFAADDDDDDDNDNDDYKNHFFNYSVSAASSAFAMEDPPKMLCFGAKQQQDQQQLIFSEPCSISKPRQKSTLTCTDSVKSHNANLHVLYLFCFNFNLQKRNGSDPEAAAIKAAPSSNQRASKKIKADAGHAKRKEKLGERITALQQLVSPFGKTDTASVLHEAMGYIKFLHEQVQVLCSPYLQHHLNSSSSSSSSSSATGGREAGEAEMDLRSRGLCLIPVECSLHLGNCTVADFWSPAMAMGRKL